MMFQKMRVLLVLIIFLSGCHEENVKSSQIASDAEVKKIPRINVYKGYTFSTPPIEDASSEEVILGGLGKFKSCETVHQYKNNSSDLVCKFDFKIKSEISLHFKNFNTEAGFDIVYINDKHNSMITMYHGALGNFWTEPISADEILIRFQSDGDSVGYGFKIDKIRIKKIQPLIRYDPKYVDVESRFESDHDVTLGPGKNWQDEVKIRQPGAEEIQIHFSLLSINSGCETLTVNEGCQTSIRILDKNRNVLREFNRSYNLKNYWLTVPGEMAYILYEVRTKNSLSGGVRSEYGYKIDRLRVKSVYPVYRYVSKYPIVFAHGLMGFNNMLGYEYFFRVKKYLEDKGFEVYMTEVPPVSSIQVRADHLAGQIKNILAESSRNNGRPIEKINFIAHSMGGLDGRVLISKNIQGKSGSSDLKNKIYGRDMGDKFATFITIGTPHHGSYIADILQGVIPNQNVQKIAVLLSNILGWFYNYPGPTSEEIIAASYELTEKFCGQFNDDHPEPVDKGIIYMAFAGIAKSTFPVRDDSAEVIPLLLPTYMIIQGNVDPAKRENDGLISFQSAQWKKEYYSTYKGYALYADHLNEVGQILGQTDPKFNHLEFYHYLASSFE